MTKTLKKILYILLGLVAGGLGWFLLEAQMSVGGGSFYFRLLLQGGIIGAVYGAVLGMGEGIALSLGKKIRSGAGIGFLIGFPGGIAAILFAQSMLLVLTGSGGASVSNITHRYLPLARFLGWVIMGGILGLIDGLRSRSLRRTLFGVVGGFAGGILGSLIFEGLSFAEFSPSGRRLAGFLALGGFLGAGLSFADSMGRFGVLKVLNGRYKGKEFILSKGNTLFGSAVRCDISLPDDPQIGPVHGRIIRRDKSMVLEGMENRPLRLNDEQVKNARLKYEDVIRCGNTVLRFIP